MTEDELIAAIRERLRDVPAQRLALGIGDDAAAWQPSRSNRSVITTDVLIEAVHFTRTSMSAEDAGWRALASNLSDLAAMGARPVLATVALAFPRDTGPAWVLACYDGIATLARRERCAIAGGDLSAAPAITISITVVGEVRASNLKTRAGARPGDVIAVTGALGASGAGRRVALDQPELANRERFADALAAFRRPQPRLREGRWLGASRHVRAMMDISDGLSTDLHRLCAASGVGAQLDAIPVHPAATAVAAATGADAVDMALNGGEDFELLVAIEKHAFGHLAGRFRAHTARDLIPLGTVVAESGVTLPNGAPLEMTGWDHFG
ncbi:MAG TPA: thiamine-phosphate kinase [Candidatus Elarobacter sp.]